MLVDMAPQVEVLWRLLFVEEESSSIAGTKATNSKKQHRIENGGIADFVNIVAALILEELPTLPVPEQFSGNATKNNIADGAEGSGGGDHDHAARRRLRNRRPWLGRLECDPASEHLHSSPPLPSPILIALRELILVTIQEEEKVCVFTRPFSFDVSLCCVHN